MNTLRQTISNLFEAPMQNMNFVSYFQYINTNGKITARSLMEIVCILATYVEEQEKINEKNEANFKDIETILAKLVDKKLDEKVVNESLDTDEFITTSDKDALRRKRIDNMAKARAARKVKNTPSV